MRKTFLAFAALLISTAASAQRVSVVVDGATRPEYFARGTTYVEALRGRNYSLRITNPTSSRVAVALSVDGLNTIDARHTDGWNASKWVLDPYESVTLDGWQVSDSTARRFVFTTERRSYGAALGQTENLGVIEAIFYRERVHEVYRYRDFEGAEQKHHAEPAPSAAGAITKPSEDDYAATGMGGRTRHDVTSIDMDLDPTPIASVRIRYEFRPQLVKLGVIDASPSPLERREKARGFDRYCPEPD